MRFLPLVLLCALLAGCGSDSGAAGSGDAELTAVATTTQLGDMVGEVGGDRVAVEQILEPNADPHDYEPRPSDAQALAEAGVVFKSGGDLDEWLDELVESAGGDAEVVEGLDAARAIEGDPHWWQDPRNAARVVEAIRDALIEADPDGRAAYERNAAAYLDRLDRLDRAVARGAGAEVGGALWADTLGRPDSDGATYVESIESNTATIVEGLTGGEAS